MNFSEIWIRRPVMSALVMFGLLFFGVVSYRRLPINNLPNVDFPTISVTASLPGANPETMAATVAMPLEKQFTTIAGIDSMMSTSTLGLTKYPPAKPVALTCEPLKAAGKHCRDRNRYRNRYRASEVKGR